VISYGSQSCNGTSVGDYCSFSCITGYGVVGASTLVCESTGSWSDPVPSCRAIQCLPDYSSMPFPHGSITHSGTNYYNAKISYNCYAGYNLVGDTYIQCQSDGDDNDGYGAWDNVPPTCEAVQCSPDYTNSTVENGEVSCTGNSYEDTCTYTCNYGYKTSGLARSNKVYFNMSTILYKFIFIRCME